MHYPNASGHVITKSQREAIRGEVKERVVTGVPADSYQDKDYYFPLQHDSSISTLSTVLLPHTDGSAKTNAVYVLECCKSNDPGLSVAFGVSSNSISTYSNLENHDRVLYVGVAKNMLKRLDEHLNSPGRDGAYFTAMYRPVRVLQVGWWRTNHRATRAEAIAAELLRERYPDDFVAYPG